MKRRLIILSIMIFAFFSSAEISQAQDSIKGFSIKFTGGYGTMAVRDLNTFIESLENYFGDAAALLGGTREGKFNEINMGFEYEAEFIVKLAGNFGIGVGAGYIQRSKDNEMSLNLELLGEATYSFVPKFTAIPVNLNVYYFYPVTPSMNLFLNGGVGYYFAKFTGDSRIDVEIPAEPSEWSEFEEEVKDRGLGFHGGIGFEFNMGSNIAFFIEGRGRYCKLKSWEGKETSTSSFGFTDKISGTMWYLEEFDSDLGKWYPFIGISKEKPSDLEIRNVREFEGDFSGISLRAGIRIKF